MVGTEDGIVIYLTYLDNRSMSNSTNRGQSKRMSVGQTSAIEELWVSLTSGEGEESGSEDKFDHGAGRDESDGAPAVSLIFIL